MRGVLSLLALIISIGLIYVSGIIGGLGFLSLWLEFIIYLSCVIIAWFAINFYAKVKTEEGE